VALGHATAGPVAAECCVYVACPTASHGTGDGRLPAPLRHRGVALDRLEPGLNRASPTTPEGPIESVQ
jgi:hypothetical protein